MTTLRVTDYNPASNLGVQAESGNRALPCCPQCGKARMFHEASHGQWPSSWRCNRTEACRRVIFYELKHLGGEYFSRRLRPILPEFPAAEDWRGPFVSVQAAERAVTE
jgi:hypothetical protein